MREKCDIFVVRKLSRFMKIFTSNDIRKLDQATIEKEGIRSIDLMERAATMVANEIISRWDNTQRIIIFAGPGNNGGDGLAVARMLIEKGFMPIILLFNTEGKLSPDCETNKQRLLQLNYPIQEVNREITLPNITKNDVVVDALFGSGLSRALVGGYMALVRTINESEAFVISIDVPSGLFGEFNKSNMRRNVVHANLTLTFQFPRLSFFFSENAECLGEWKVLDIGLDKEATETIPTNNYLIDEEGVRKGLRPRNPFSSKDNYGRIYIAAGSFGMMGAALLCAKAAMRSGAGVVTVHAPSCGYIVTQTALPEVLFDEDANSRFISKIQPHPKTSAIAIGPGIGRQDATISALSRFLKEAKSPVVLDADALNCIAEQPTMLNDIPRNSVITPHIGEFNRLFGETYSDEDRYLKAIDMARTLKIYIILKGHYTMVFRPDGKVYFNNTGNAGMATAGSGDVLTGIVTAMLGQGYQPHIATTLATFIHGYAGNLARQQKGEVGMMASDIVENIGQAFKLLMETPTKTNQ